jgi:hypothetical protein
MGGIVIRLEAMGWQICVTYITRKDSLGHGSEFSVSIISGEIVV